MLERGPTSARPGTARRTRREDFLLNLLWLAIFAIFAWALFTNV